MTKVVTLVSPGQLGEVEFGAPFVGGFIDPTKADYDLIIRKSATVTALGVGFVGDSITAGTVVATAPPTPCAAKLTQGGLTVTPTNQGVSGATTTTWLPGSANMTAALAAFAAAGVRLVHVMLGTNDAKTTGALTKAQYRANLQAICGALVAAGYVVAVSYPPYLSATTGVFDAGSPARVASYCAAIDSLVDNNHIFHGDTSAQTYFQSNPSAMQVDGVHPTQAGSDTLAGFWSAAVQGLVNGLSNTVALTRAVLGPGITASGMNPVTIDVAGGSFGAQEQLRVSFAAPTVGMQRRLVVPKALRIDGWYLVSDVAGSAVVDIYADAFANYPPGSVKTICGGSKPALASANHATDNALTGWLKTLADDQVLVFNVDSVTGIGALDVCLTCTRVSSAAPTVTWNPSDKEAGFTLASGNLQITRGGGSNTWGGIRATLSRSAATANHYFEFVPSNAEQMAGVALAAQPITAARYIGDTASGWAHYASTGKKINAGVQTAYGVTWTAGDVIGVLLKNGNLYFSKNGVWMNSADPIAETGWAFSGIVGSVYPAASMFTSGSTSTARFKAADFTGALPAGSAAWGG